VVKIKRKIRQPRGGLVVVVPHAVEISLDAATGSLKVIPARGKLMLARRFARLRGLQTCSSRLSTHALTYSSVALSAAIIACAS
jgi:hypothetical protein